MKTYSRLTLAFLLLMFVVPQVGADEPPLNGPYVEYYGNGQKKLETHFKNGEQDGRVTDWHKNGQKKADGHFRNGKRDGLVTWWYENGQKQFVGHWDNGVQHGRVNYWYTSGQKKAAGHFKNGKRDGLAAWWDENGQKTKEIRYKNGTPDRHPILTSDDKQDGEYRNWKDRTGKFSIVGKFLELKNEYVETKKSSREKNDIVLIQKKDGSVIKVPLQRLSAPDKRYVLDRVTNSLNANRKLKIEIQGGSIKVNGQLLPAHPEKIDLIKVFGKPRLWPTAVEKQRGKSKDLKNLLFHPWPHLVWDEYGIYANMGSMSPKVWKLGIRLTEDPKTNRSDPVVRCHPKRPYSGRLVLEEVNISAKSTEDEISQAKLSPYSKEKTLWISKSKPKITLLGGAADPFRPPVWKELRINFSSQ